MPHPCEVGVTRGWHAPDPVMGIPQHLRTETLSLGLNYPDDSSLQTQGIVYRFIWSEIFLDRTGNIIWQGLDQVFRNFAPPHIHKLRFETVPSNPVLAHIIPTNQLSAQPAGHRPALQACGLKPTLQLRQHHTTKRLGNKTGCRLFAIRTSHVATTHWFPLLSLPRSLSQVMSQVCRKSSLSRGPHPSGDRAACSWTRPSTTIPSPIKP